MIDLRKVSPSRATSTFTYEGATFEVGGFNHANPDFTTAMFEAGNAAKPKKDEEPDEGEFEIQVLARLVTSWENVGLDGAELECTLENKLKVIREFPDLRRTLALFAQNRGNYRELVKDAVGN